MIGRTAESAIPVLAAQIDLEYGEGASVLAADALGRIGPPAQTAATVLFQALNLRQKEFELECRPRLRLAAAVAIRRVGADTGPTVPVLISLLSIEETPVFHSRFVGRRLAAGWPPTFGETRQALSVNLAPRRGTRFLP